MGKLMPVHLHDQNGIKYDQDKAFGVENLLYGKVPKDVCGCMYTQLSDVEDEINGFCTYDRRVCKVNLEKMNKIAEKLGRLQG